MGSGRSHAIRITTAWSFRLVQINIGKFGWRKSGKLLDGIHGYRIVRVFNNHHVFPEPIRSGDLQRLFGHDEHLRGAPFSAEDAIGGQTLAFVAGIVSCRTEPLGHFRYGHEGCNIGNRAILIYGQDQMLLVTRTLVLKNAGYKVASTSEDTAA